ncbi:MAG: hypothetical protein KKD18_00855 [Nanoarchaeota archaeon]|nr:hypothetical protein [Nanoarchaeota archaeon]MBU0976947.1 hypothetical protein [Nanoarchaeota archaeon]
MRKPYKAQSKLLGPCGPCCFINLTGMKGSPKKEIELSKIGRRKPFGGTDYTGFLEWGKKHNLPIQVFTTSNKQDNKMFKFIFKFEKIPQSKRKQKKKEAKERFESQNKKFKDKVFLIKNVKSKLNSLLKTNKKVAVCLAVNSSVGFQPHWVVAYKHQKNKYHFMDSAKGLKGYRILSPHQLSKAFRKSKEMGFPPALVMIKK